MKGNMEAREKAEKTAVDAKDKKPVKKEAGAKGKTKSQSVADLIENGKYTKEEIIKKAAEFDCPSSSVTTMISHGQKKEKLCKYKAFPNVIVINPKTKKLSFKK
jgi:hypothetical protein